MYLYGACLFYVCCSDCVRVCGNVCRVAAVVKNSVLALECRSMLCVCVVCMYVCMVVNIVWLRLWM